MMLVRVMNIVLRKEGDIFLWDVMFFLFVGGLVSMRKRVLCSYNSIFINLLVFMFCGKKYIGINVMMRGSVM